MAKHKKKRRSPAPKAGWKFFGRYFREKRAMRSMLDTICQLECELDVREAQLAALKRGRANMLRWAKRYRKLVRKHMEDKYAESSQD